MRSSAQVRSPSKQILVAAGVLLFLTSNVQASTITLTFDRLAPLTELTNQFETAGVRFSNSSTPLRAQTATPGPPFTAPIAILPENFRSVSTNRADFLP